MKTFGPEKKGIGAALSPGVYPEGGLGSTEAELESLKLSRQNESAWTYRGRSVLLESISTSLWSWLVVGILSAWFSIWLVETIGRLGSRMP